MGLLGAIQGTTEAVVVSMDFAQWLAERYDEAEARARAADPAPWASTPPSLYIDSPGVGIIVQTRHFETAEFVAATDPAHRLADIKLKRAILAEHAPMTGLLDRLICRVCWSIRTDGGPLDGDLHPCATVRQLGTEFAGHAGYLESWRP